jgi:hypothetical protein
MEPKLFLNVFKKFIKKIIKDNKYNKIIAFIWMTNLFKAFTFKK